MVNKQRLVFVFAVFQYNFVYLKIFAKCFIRNILCVGKVIDLSVRKFISVGYRNNLIGMSVYTKADISGYILSEIE